MTTTPTRAQIDASAYAALQAAGGNATHAAAAAGMARTSFRAAIARHTATLDQAREDAMNDQAAAAADTAAETFTAQPARTLAAELTELDRRAGEAEAAEADKPEAPAAEAKPCACECGELVTRKFARGHDSRLLSKLRAAVVAKELTSVQAIARAEEISSRFAGKVTKSMNNMDKVRAVTTGPLTPCPCGCGELVARTFARGHDSKFAQELRAGYVAGNLTRDEVMGQAKMISEAFTRKMVKQLAAADAKAAAADAKAAAKAGQEG